MNYKYKIILKWPPECRSRSFQDMVSRPDLLQTISEFRAVVEEVADMRTKYGTWEINGVFKPEGLSVFFEKQKDVARFAQVMAIEAEPVELVETVHNDNPST